jgi:CheY-like chemotaxis protein
MSIVSRLAESMGARLQVKVTKQQIVVQLQGAARAAVDSTLVAPADAFVQKAATVVDWDAAPLQGRVLLAEDNAVNQQLIQKVLRKLGLQVLLAVNGQEAIDIASSEPVDLILMDVNMPELDGLSATRQLREAGFDQPIYALTAEQGSQEVAKCLQAGCNGHLAKPLELNRLRSVLTQHLRARDHAPIATRRIPDA